MRKDAKDTLNSDVVIVGGGPAGFGAAVAAARKGLNVYLLESGDLIGGIMATCPGMPIGAAYPREMSIGGILDEFLNRLYKMKPAAAEKRNCRLVEFGPEVFYDHEIAIYTLFQMLEEAGVHLLLNATALEPVMDGNRVTTVIYHDKSGQHAIAAQALIDCSGDGYIAAGAGVPYDKGDEVKGHMMAVSLTFFLVNVEVDKIAEYDDPYFTKYAEKGVKSGRLHEDLHKIYWFPGFHDNMIFFNAVHIKDIDGTNPSDIQKAYSEARKRVRQLAKYFKEEIQGFENSHVETIGPTVGVRETRRFKGIYKLTGDDIFAGAKFTDGVVCCDNAIDNVCRGSNISEYVSLIEKGLYYQVPFRCMVPKHIENLLFAGRCISADSVALASMRGMATCMGLGQAAGTAAAMAVKDNNPFQNINHKVLIQQLRDQGVNGLNPN
jgi:glycine/D-amino acid oxidase-like deaminating enzyme